MSFTSTHSGRVCWWMDRAVDNQRGDRAVPVSLRSGSVSDIEFRIWLIGIAIASIVAGWLISMIMEKY